MILAIDTSTELTSVAITDGDVVVAERRHRDPRRHAEVTSPLVVEILAGVDRGAVTALACGVGPGAYTGLRVGIATARALGLAWSVPVYGLCSLDAIASAWLASGADAPFGVACDARRREVYWATYGPDGRRSQGPRVNAPADLDDDAAPGIWVGHGAALHGDDLPGTVIGTSDESALAFPSAAWIGRRVQALLDAGARPADPVVELVRHGDDGTPTAQALAGSALLPPLPLYLRRADTTEPRAS